MSVLNELYQLTKALYEEVQKSVPKENRDTQIEKITQLLNERQGLINNLNPPFSEEEKEVGMEIVRLNKVIDSNLNSIFNTIKIDIRQLKMKKEKTTKYVNPYEDFSVDGMFLDKRK